MRYLKESPEGVSEICKVIEDMQKKKREEGIKEDIRTAALRMLADGALALEMIAGYVGLPLDIAEKL